MNFPPQFLDELRARLPVSDRAGRAVRLARRGREHVGLCPFHQEKTPSFTVNDDKGFFHCFGCGAHGDVIGFAMQHEGLAFADAVAQLAGEAGLPLPERTPEARAQAKRRGDLRGVLEFAADWFARALAARDGAAGARYLAARGVTARTIAAFRLGYAPTSGRALAAALGAAGIAVADACEAGLLRPAEGGRPVRDFFRGRVMFPIGDARGRIVGFGGRSLGDAQPKYLNSPESPVFSKRATLYNLAAARPAAREAGTVLVAEGYMDVIALVQAGFGNAAAPLGTALGEQQMRELWRLAAEPVLCLDGDRAGRAAASRAARRALPLLAPGRSLTFAFLPEGEDPDSVLRGAGAQAMRDHVAAGAPLVDLLWRELTAGRNVATPERRAGLRQDIDRRLAEIADDRVRAQYRQAFRARFERAYGARRRLAGRAMRPGGAFEPAVAPLDTGARRERLMLATALNHPELLPDLVEDLAEIDFRAAGLRRLRDLLVDFAATAEEMTAAALRAHLAAADAEGYAAQVLGGGQLAESFARASADGEAAQAGFRHLVARYRRDAVVADLRAAEAALSERMDAAALAHLVQLRHQLDAIDRLDDAAVADAGASGAAVAERTDA